MMRLGISLSGGERNFCFLNLGGSSAGTSFADVGALSGFDFPDDGRGLASVDWDRDGDLDFWISNRTAPTVRFLRNQSAGANFIAFKLTGTACNRDAIGATVEVVSAGGVRQSQMLRAGDGFVSQSSKWLHFGLGAESSVAQVTVRWPGGAAEDFGAEKAGGFYRIAQGSGKLEAGEVAPPAPPLAEGSVDVPAESSRAALVFPAEIRSPILSFEKFDGGRVQAMPEKALVVLWASSCPTCAAELRALAAAKPQLDAAGIRVLALAIDGLGSTPGSPAEALAFLQKIRFPHGGGMATEETLEKFQVLHREFYYRPYHLPVPASFLVGSGGKLISVYRGEAVAAEVIAHFQAVEGGADREAAAAPYPGRWIRSERVYFNPANYFARLSDLGWIDDAAALAEDLWAGELPDATRLFVAHRCGADFLKAGRFPEAQRWFERALAIDPEHAQSLNNLGAVLQQSGDRFGAEASYRSASAADPAYAAPLQNLGVLLLKSGRADEAAGPLAKLVDLTPDDAEAWRTYGAALAEKGGFADAEAAYRKALALEPDDAAAPIALAKISLLREDPAQAKAFLDQALAAERITPEQTAEVIRLSEAASK